MSQVDLWELERGLAAQGLGAICGVDEAGAGLWPVRCAQRLFCCPWASKYRASMIPRN